MRAVCNALKALQHFTHSSPNSPLISKFTTHLQLTSTLVSKLISTFLQTHFHFFSHFFNLFSLFFTLISKLFHTYFHSFSHSSSQFNLLSLFSASFHLIYSSTFFYLYLLFTNFLFSLILFQNQ